MLRAKFSVVLNFVRERLGGRDLLKILPHMHPPAHEGKVAASGCSSAVNTLVGELLCAGSITGQPEVSIFCLDRMHGSGMARTNIRTRCVRRKNAQGHLLCSIESPETTHTAAMYFLRRTDSASEDQDQKA